jgi:hypothetical protein
MPRRELLLDACVAINLAAAARLDQIADALQVTFIIVAQAASEAGYLRDVVKGTTVLTPINLDQFASSEALEIRELAPAELTLYLELASIVDDRPGHRRPPSAPTLRGATLGRARADRGLALCLCRGRAAGER